MKKVVLFDFHNTLATCDGWLELEIKTLPGLALDRLRSNGYLSGAMEHSAEEAARLFRELRADVRRSGVELSAFEGTRRVMEQMGYRVPNGVLLAVIEELEYSCLVEVKIMPGAHECLERLVEGGYRLGVVSSAGFPPFVERALEVLGLREYVREVLTSAGEGIYKSDPEIFRRAAARLDAVPGEAVHVGDHALFDVQAARKAGLSAIWFAAEAERTARLHGADWEELVRAGSEAEGIVMRLEDVQGVVERMG